MVCPGTHLRRAQVPCEQTNEKSAQLNSTRCNDGSDNPTFGKVFMLYYGTEEKHKNWRTDTLDTGHRTGHRAPHHRIDGPANGTPIPWLHVPTLGVPS